ncbi:TetR/AcrR family transcriptional regulator [Sedimentitalea sp. XS_ASV28]|uniref:TetR/AcrR family transcriptional regulator n=1 Tax=Sedimentitalea sp. XS_ASV28 TaxID=3241296 RepID=UPI003518F994
MTRSNASKQAKHKITENNPKRPNPLAAPGRRKPKQKRSRETVEEILQAAIRVMERGGFEAFNMPAIAAEAGLNVATLYSYFANKHKLLARLAEDGLAERLRILEELFEEARQAPDWIDKACAAITRLARLRSDQSGATALRRALHASPELWRIDQNGNRIAGKMVADLIVSRSETPCADPELRGRMIAEYVTVILDMQRDFPADKHDAILADLTAVFRFHLSMGDVPADVEL